MDSQSYTCAITVGVTPKDAFDGIARFADWWTKHLEGSAKNAGDIFTVRFGKTYVTCEVVESVPDSKIIWLVTDAHLDWLDDTTEWNGTKMRWEIEPAQDATRVTFTHVGLVPKITCYGDCSKGWDQYIKQSLFKLLNEGKGLPDEF